MSKTTIVALGVALLAGCSAQSDPPGFPMSGVAPEINQVNVPDLTRDITFQLAGAFGPKDGAVTIAGDNQIVGDELARSLKAGGYRVVPKNGKHSILYAVNTLGPTLMVSWRIDGQRFAKLYRGGPTGELVSATPTTLTER